MGDDDSRPLRARIEAQVAARRSGAAVRTRRERPGHRRTADLDGSAAASTVSLNGAVVPAAPAAGRNSDLGLAHGPPAGPAPVAHVNGTRTDGSRLTATHAKARRAGRGPWGLALRLVLLTALAVVVAVVLRSFVIASYYIPSASMQPTLHGCPGCNNDHVLVNKLSYYLHPVHRGDVVVFHRPPGAPTDEPVLIKRVIGLPGDVLTDRDGVLYVNGDQLVEPYLDPACPGGTRNFAKAGVRVPAGEVYVLGDNRCDSLDSRMFGPVAESSIIGRAFMIIWPLGRLHYL